MQTVTHIFARTFAILGLVFLAQTQAQAQQTLFLEGGHYQVMTNPQPVSTGDKIEVLELFWYRCPHCNSLEAPLHTWLKNGKPDNAEYVAFPAILNPNWEPAARAYYTFEALGLVDEFHAKLFYAIHSERKNINSSEQLAKWVESEGGSAKDVTDTYDSFAVNTKVNFAKTMSKRYGVSGVPAIIVDGRYSTSVSQAGDTKTLFEVINFLVEKAAADRAG